MLQQWVYGLMVGNTEGRGGSKKYIQLTAGITWGRWSMNSPMFTGGPQHRKANCIWYHRLIAPNGFFNVCASRKHRRREENANDSGFRDKEQIETGPACLGLKSETIWNVKEEERSEIFLINSKHLNEDCKIVTHYTIQAVFVASSVACCTRSPWLMGWNKLEIRETWCNLV